MRKWIIAPIGLALLTAACGETTGQRAGTGAATGALAGAFLGPIGALVGAGIGAAGGAYRPTVDRTVADGVGAVEKEIDQAMNGNQAQAAEAQPRALRAGEQRMGIARADDLTNEEVREAQIALSDMGLFEGEIDGMYGRRTIAAVGEFQSRHDLPQTRALDDRTQERIQMAASEAKQKGAQKEQAPQTQQSGVPAAEEKEKPKTE